MSERVNLKSEVQERLLVLRHLIREGEPSTQDELCTQLHQKKFDVNQSTVSRDLRRIGAIKTTNDEGEIVYKLPEDHVALVSRNHHNISPLINEIEANESMIVIHTSPGSASLVAADMDRMRVMLGILGTLSGDDTVFVAPVSTKKIQKTIQKIKEEYL